MILVDDFNEQCIRGTLAATSPLHIVNTYIEQVSVANFNTLDENTSSANCPIGSSGQIKREVAA